MAKINKEKEYILVREEVNRLLRYEPESGLLHWKVDVSRRVKAGAVAGCLHKATNYHVTRIKGYLYRSHRLIWFIVTGNFPVKFIDHINGDKSDNRLVNLREATAQENNRNRVKQSNNTSGVTGVCWVASRGKWLARIYNQQKICEVLGYFDDIDAASAAYLAKRNEYFGAFVNGF